MPETPTPHRTRSTVPHPGLVVAGRYELLHLLASGGMAEVWEAVDHVLERPVAVKVLHRHLTADEAFSRRFRAEAIAAARLHHHSIVAIYDTCHDDDLEAIVMELVRGRTLRDYLDEQGRLECDEVVQIGADVADALAAAHRAGIVHRDVKPANILLCDDDRVMVTDFGIAKVRDSADLTSNGTMVGTVKYLSPEQVEGRAVDPRSDLYALGVVLYEALLGRPPFSADTPAATALARLHQTPPRPRSVRPDVPVALDTVLMRVLDRDPEHRFADAASFRAALLAPRVLPLPATEVADTGDLTQVTPVDRPVDATASHARPPTAQPQPAGVGAPPPRPAPGAAPRAPAEPPRRRASWLLPLVVLVVVGGSLALAAALVARTEAGDDLIDQVDQVGLGAAPVVVQQARPFDPLGDEDENGSMAVLAIDADPATVWRTETYQSRTFGNLKAGVGLVVDLDREADLDTIVLRSPTAGWTAQLYVGDGSETTLDAWGEPVAELTADAGATSVDLDGARGQAVLVWIVDLGDGANRVEIGDLTVAG